MTCNEWHSSNKFISLENKQKLKAIQSTIAKCNKNFRINQLLTATFDCNRNKLIISTRNIDIFLVLVILEIMIFYF